MMIDRRALLAVPSLGALLAGCPEDTPPAADAFVAPTPDAYMTPGTDAGPDMTDAFTPPDDDAFVVAMDDAFVPSDAGPEPLPAIVNPDPHLVAASADGHDRLFGVTFAPDSSFYVVGVRAAGTTATEDYSTIVGHFGADGELDTAFGTDGWFVHDIAVGTSTNNEVARGIALQSDGKLIVTATVQAAGAADPRDRDVAVLRLTTDGELDTSFDTDGIRIIDLSAGEVVGMGFTADSTWNVLVDSMDRILLAVGPKREGGTDTDFGILRLTSAGATDTTFGGGDGLYTRDIDNLNASVRDITLLADGSIAGAGYFNVGGSSVRPAIYLVDTNGAPITTFGTDGLYTELILMAQVEAYAAAVQGDHFVTAGYGRDLGPDDNDFISLRVNATTGARDTTYGGSAGYFLLSGYDFNDNARTLAVLPDERVLMVGALRTETMAADAALVMLTPDGVLDTTYDTDGVRLTNIAGGTVDHFWGVSVDPRGERVVVVGIGGTDPTSDDDALVYLFPVP